jgi:hypothetical protein
MFWVVYRWPAVNTDSMTAIRRSTLQKMWNPQHLTTPWVSMACYKESFTFVNVDSVHTSQKYTYVPPRPITGIALVLYMYMIFVPHRKHLWASTACYRDSFTCFICKWPESIRLQISSLSSPTLMKKYFKTTSTSKRSDISTWTISPDDSNGRNRLN